jgi:hypothetical protein
MSVSDSVCSKQMEVSYFRFLFSENNRKLPSLSVRKRGDMETWRWRHGNMETYRHGDIETWRHGDMETWRHGDMETWRHGDITW